jgi:predicted nucleotidyltransferase
MPQNNWLQTDGLDVLRAFVKTGVRFIIVGGQAVRFHGHLRPAKDLDVFVERTPENWDRLRAALKSVGTTLNEAFDDLSDNPKAKGGVCFYDVEFLTAITGVSFSDAWDRALQVVIDNDLQVRVIAKSDLISSKLNTGRSVDTEDVRALESLA